MYQLTYISVAVPGLSDADVRAMATKAAEENKRLGITGLLLYNKVNFIQAIEGDRETVRALYDRIRQDRRHTRVEVIEEGDIPQRIFPDWAMNYCFLSSATAELPNALPSHLAIPLRRSFTRMAQLGLGPFAQS